MGEGHVITSAADMIELDLVRDDTKKCQDKINDQMAEVMQASEKIQKIYQD